MTRERLKAGKTGRGWCTSMKVGGGRWMTVRSFSSTFAMLDAVVLALPCWRIAACRGLVKGPDIKAVKEHSAQPYSMPDALLHI